LSTTSIEWTDVTWNPVTGCRKVSPGCAHCYAATWAARQMGQWEGRAFEDVRTHPDRLAAPLHWRKPRRVFVNSMSDLFHDDVPDQFIAAVFAVMNSCALHTFQILTKRPERMRAFMGWLVEQGGIDRYVRSDVGRSALRRFFDGVARFTVERDGKNYRADNDPWMWVFNCAAVSHVGPLPNAWLGVSVEDQEHADERVPILLDTPAAVRFVSYEPALGPVDFMRWMVPPPECTCYEFHGGHQMGCPMYGATRESIRRWEEAHMRSLDWIICGGESGPGARPFDVGWARLVVQQCRIASTPCFVKQLGARPRAARGSDFLGHAIFDDGTVRSLRDRKGGDMAEWPEDLRVREFPR